MSLDELVNTNAVLIIDDEYTDVQALMSFLDRYNIEYDYAATLEEGIGFIFEAAEGGQAYGAIVLDNHFRNLYLPPGFPEDSFDGIHLASLVAGNYAETAFGLFEGYASQIKEAYPIASSSSAGVRRATQSTTPTSSNQSSR